MEEHLCANCGALLPPTGTYCLACDTPVAQERSALSVAETFVAARGKPLQAVAWVVGTVVLVGGIGYGILTMARHHSDGQASNAAVHGVELIMRAESGHSGACDYAAAAIAGDARRVENDCKAVVGADPRADIRRLHTVSTHRSGDRGTVELRGTWVDAKGRTPFRRTVQVLSETDGWVLVWDGKALTPTVQP